MSPYLDFLSIAARVLSARAMASSISRHDASNDVFVFFTCWEDTTRIWFKMGCF